MERKKQDLRVIKTKRSIKKVFSDLVTKKPLDKITVTEIAALAEINKGTFYLHYSDIYALFEEFVQDFVEDFTDRIDFYPYFFDDPKEFVRKYFEMMKSLPPREVFPFSKQDHRNPRLPLIITDALKKKIFSLNKIPETFQNEIRLEYVLTGMIFLYIRYGGEHSEDITAVVAESIEASFKF